TCLVQNDTLRANCITRGSPESVVILPTAPLVTLEFGCPNSGVLLTLKTSHRNCRLALSVIWKSLVTAPSKTVLCGPGRVVRPLLPTTPGGSTWNALAENQWNGFPVTLAAPTTLGTAVACPKGSSAAPRPPPSLTVKGWPL